MLLSSLKKLFGTHAAAPAPAVPASINLPIRAAVGGVQYPPQDPGFVCPNPENLIAAQSDVMGMLRTHAACPTAHFDERYRLPILNLAEYIANLPGSPSGVFAGEGGLFRACVEMAFNSFRASDGRIFTGMSGVEERHLLEGRWRYVCFMAGLLYPVGASVQAMEVIDTNGARWSAELDPLQQWVGTDKRFYVSWSRDDVTPGPSPIMGMLVQRIIGRKNIDWLNEGSPDLIKRLVEIISGSPVAKSLIATDVVSSVWSSVHEREMARRYQNYGRLVVGSHISPYVLDAMSGLIASKWKINEKTVFVDGTDVYLEWPAAGLDIIEYCQARGYQGIPAHHSALMVMLSANNIIVAGIDGVAISEIANQDGEIVAAVKLSKPSLLVEDMAQYAKVKQKPVALVAVVDADPLTAPSPEKKAKPKKVEQKQSVAQPTLDTLEIDEDDIGAEKPVDAVVIIEKSMEPEVTQKVAPSTSIKPVEAESKNQQLAQLKEGEEISYAGLVCADILVKLKPYAAETLGKVIHAWREKIETKYVFRMTTVGVAIEQEFVLLASSPELGPNAILEWAAAGLLYIDPTRPGIKIHQISVSEGSIKKVNCIVFSMGVADRLGMR